MWHHATGGGGEGGGGLAQCWTATAGRQWPGAGRCRRRRPLRGTGVTSAQNRGSGSLMCGASTTVLVGAGQMVFKSVPNQFKMIEMISKPLKL
jgi:hypothetical protein